MRVLLCARHLRICHLPASAVKCLLLCLVVGLGVCPNTPKYRGTCVLPIFSLAVLITFILPNPHFYVKNGSLNVEFCFGLVSSFPSTRHLWATKLTSVLLHFHHQENEVFFLTIYMCIFKKLWCLGS